MKSNTDSCNFSKRLLSFLVTTIKVINYGVQYYNDNISFQHYSFRKFYGKLYEKSIKLFLFPKDANFIVNLHLLEL